MYLLVACPYIYGRVCLYADVISLPVLQRITTTTLALAFAPPTSSPAMSSAEPTFNSFAGDLTISGHIYDRVRGIGMDFAVTSVEQLAVSTSQSCHPVRFTTDIT